MKKTKSLLLCVLIIGLMMTAVSCGSNAGDGNYPPNSGQLSKLIGKEKDTAFKKLDLQEEDVVYELREYRLTKQVEYLGYSFDVYLQTDTSTEEQEMYGFSYRLSFIDNEKEAITCVKAIKEKLDTLYGEGDRDTNDFKQKIEKTTPDGKLPNGLIEWNLSKGLTLFFRADSAKTEDGNQVQSISIQYRSPFPS